MVKRTTRRKNSRKMRKYRGGQTKNLRDSVSQMASIYPAAQVTALQSKNPIKRLFDTHAAYWDVWEHAFFDDHQENWGIRAARAHDSLYNISISKAAGGTQLTDAINLYIKLRGGVLNDAASVKSGLDEFLTKVIKDLPWENDASWNGNKFMPPQPVPAVPVSEFLRKDQGDSLLSSAPSTKDTRTTERNKLKGAAKTSLLIDAINSSFYPGLFPLNDAQRVAEYAAYAKASGGGGDKIAAIKDSQWAPLVDGGVKAHVDALDALFKEITGNSVDFYTPTTMPLVKSAVGTGEWKKYILASLAELTKTTQAANIP